MHCTVFSSVPAGSPSASALVGSVLPSRFHTCLCRGVQSSGIAHQLGPVSHLCPGASKSLGMNAQETFAAVAVGVWVHALPRTCVFFRELTQRIRSLPGFYYSIKQCTIFSALICFEIIQPYFIMPDGTHQYCLCICLMRVQ